MGYLTIRYPFLLIDQVERHGGMGTVMSVQRTSQNRILTALSVGALLLCAAPGALAQSRYATTPAQTSPHPHAQHLPSTFNLGPQAAGRYGQTQQVRAGIPAASTAPSLGAQFQQWVEWEPTYTLVPGDQLEVVVGSAPELSRTLTVGPDGRILMPMSQPVMAAGRTFMEVQASLMAELGQQLRDPRISVTPRAYAPEQIYVGGQVNQPGTYTIANRIGALEAIFMAGGARTSAKTEQVAVLRRAPNGGMMLRTVNIRGGLKNIVSYDDNIQLRRGDIIFVPATRLSEVGTFVQAVREALPFDFNIGYQFGLNNDGGGATPVITP